MNRNNLEILDKDAKGFRASHSGFINPANGPIRPGKTDGFFSPAQHQVMVTKEAEGWLKENLGIELDEVPKKARTNRV